MMHSSTDFGSISARRTASATTFAPSCVAENGVSPPWNFPMGVRTALSMTAESIALPRVESFRRETEFYALYCQRSISAVAQAIL